MAKGRPFLKNSILAQLAKLEGGELQLRDEEGTLRAGTAGGLQTRVEVHDPAFYRRMALGGTMAVAETYIHGDWDCDDLYSLFRLFARQRKSVAALDGGMSRWTRPVLLFGEWMSANTRKGSRRNISAHYDLGNDLFELFLDDTLTYSSAYFEKEDMTLKEASVAKLDRMCRQLELKEGEHLLEIGSGWGSMAMHAASRYGARVTTLTLSKEQKALADERMRQAGLEHLIEVKLQDYRDVQGHFDKLVSIEMIEAVGPQYFGTYFRQLHQLLKPGGLAAIQAITLPDQAYADHLKNVDFIQKYIFPGSKIPSVSVLLKAATEGTSLVMTDLHDLTLDYAKTMCIWRENFVAKLDEVRALGYDERFIRMWDYYLNYCAAGFAERYLGTVQMTFRKL